MTPKQDKYAIPNR